MGEKRPAHEVIMGKIEALVTEAAPLSTGGEGACRYIAPENLPIKEIVKIDTQATLLFWLLGEMHIPPEHLAGIKKRLVELSGKSFIKTTTNKLFA